MPAASDAASPTPAPGRSAWPAWTAPTLSLAGAALVSAAWALRPDGEGLLFNIVFSVGMLGVNGGWLAGAWIVARELAVHRRAALRRGACWSAALAVLVSQAVFL